MAPSDTLGHGQTSNGPDTGGGDGLEVLAEQASRLVVDQVSADPYRTVLVAFGLGYVLGGGVPRWALRMGLNAAARMAVGAAAGRTLGD